MNSSATTTSSSNLYAASKIIQSNCNGENLSFIRCKKENEEPSACLESGGKVMGCVVATVEHLSSKCKESFESYRGCLDANNLGFDKCRKEERALTRCFNNTTTEASQSAASPDSLTPSTH